MVTIWFTSLRMLLLGVTNTGNTATDPDIATEFVILGAKGRLELAGRRGDSLGVTFTVLVWTRMCL